LKIKNSQTEIKDLFSAQRGTGWKFLPRELGTSAMAEFKQTTFSPSLSCVNSCSVRLFAKNPTWLVEAEVY